MPKTNDIIYQIDQPVVFFPGTLCDERIFNSCWQHLDIPMRAFVPLQWAEDLAQMKMLSADRLAYFEPPVHLVGYSLGGYVAALTASENQGRIASLTLIACACDELPEDDVQQRQQLLKLIKYKQYSGMTDTRLNSFFHDCHHQNCEYVNILKQMEQDLGSAVLAAQLAAIYPRKNLLPGLSKCPFPIHLVSGEQDNLVSEATMFTMNKLLPNSDMTLIKKAGHMLPIEQSRALAEYLASKIR
ncbi:alpha/beta hydrolase [uncultured Paraglaciecola sp.]|uniref:alpha/beta fold hydrolase n=1 Tax=uncultured Paraglaciecola sp. TaxID=1765024 RepID=UPI00260BA033|nr:alpha/beta hydrolase [uncultured Paraglaciecola sp.]